MKLVKSFFCQEAGGTVVEVPGDEIKVKVRHSIDEEQHLTINCDTSRTYGSNSWMTLSNLKTENSLVENAEKGTSTQWIQMFIFNHHRDRYRWCVSELSRGLTEDSSHRQDEQLQQRVLFLVGQTQEAHLGHFGEVRDSSPYNLQGGRHTL